MFNTSNQYVLKDFSQFIIYHLDWLTFIRFLLLLSIFEFFSSTSSFECSYQDFGDNLFAFLVCVDSLEVGRT